jgi:DNA-binding beta-propeller fold protein YncE
MVGDVLQSGCRAWSRWIMWICCVLVSGCAGTQAMGGTASAPLLTPRSTLSGARVITQPNPILSVPQQRGLQGHLQWLAPTVVAVRNTFLYVADSGRRQIFRYDTAQQVMTPFAEYSGVVRSMAVAPDLSLYVSDADARQIFHFAADGRLLRSFSNSFDLGRPVAVLLDESSGQLLVADSLYNHVIVFNSLGQTVAALKSMETRGIEAMARGPDGLYLVDRSGRQVAVLSTAGGDLYTVGAGTLHDPNAIAVDRFNRIFVSDVFDNTIKVYERGEMIATIGGAGATPASFNRITSLWLEHNLLYVADSLNGRIQIFQIAPPGAKGRVRE